MLTIVSLLASPVAPLAGAGAGGRRGAAPAPPTAAGRAPTRRRAAPRSSSTSRRSRAGSIRSTPSSTPRCPTRRRARTKPALGTIKVESDTSVALDERLVSFSEFKITESNFPTLPREQLQTVVEEIAASVPLDERVIALDRVLANIDTSQIIPKNVEGVKADPPPIFFSKTPAVLVNIDGDPIWAPIPQNDLKSAVNTNWDLFEHTPTKTYYLRNDTDLAEGDRREGAVGTGRHAAGELQEAARRRQLEGGEGEPAGQEGRAPARRRRCSSACSRRS